MDLAAVRAWWAAADPDLHHEHGILAAGCGGGSAATAATAPKTGEAASAWATARRGGGAWPGAMARRRGTTPRQRSWIHRSGPWMGSVGPDRFVGLN